MKTNPSKEAVKSKKMPEKEFWLFHPAIGHYKPAPPDPITGIDRIEILEEWKISKGGALISKKRI